MNPNPTGPSGRARLNACLTRRSTRLAACIAAAIATANAPLPAHAEDAGNVLEEIIVTANRRAENLQSVPIAVTAVSGEALARSVIRSTVDLQALTPGLVFTTNSLQGQPYVRGIGSDIQNIGTDGSVAMHVDGVYQARPSAAIQDFLDVARVEVVKGPQGTLYGRNATGGAINILTNDPVYELGGKIDLSVGNYDKQRGEVVLNVPITNDTAALRLAVLGSSRDGYVRNLLTGTRSDDEGIWQYRGKLRLDPRSDLSIMLSVDAVRENSNRNLGPKVDVTLPSPAVDFFGAVIPPDPRDVNYDMATWERRYLTSETLKIRWDLGAVVLTSLTSYGDLETRTNLDIDATEVPFSWEYTSEDSRTITQELQLASNDSGRLRWIGGIYYLNEDATQNFRILFPPFQADIFYPDVRNKTDAGALFGQATYAVTDRLRVTAGLRYSREKREGFFHQTVTDPLGILTQIPGGAVIDVGSRGSKTWSAWTPKLGVDFDVAPDVMAYASITRGFKSGGFNLLGAGETFQPEFIWNYEAGLKSTLLDRRLRMNLAMFYYDYTDLQVNRFNPATGGSTSTVTNAAAAHIKGFEAEIQSSVATGLDLDFSMALLDAKFGQFLTSNPDAPDPFQLLNLNGNTLPRAPKFTAGAGLQYELPVGGRTLTLRGEARYQGHLWFDQFNSPRVEQDAYTVTNAFATLESADRSWHVRLYGRNLTDRLYKQSVVRATSVVGTLNFWGAPRTYGVEIGYQY
jgi:iron complex outermembrane receptor protein